MGIFTTADEVLETYDQGASFDHYILRPLNKCPCWKLHLFVLFGVSTVSSTATTPVISATTLTSQIDTSSQSGTTTQILTTSGGGNCVTEMSMKLDVNL